MISSWWAHAIGDLGLSEEEFLNLTPGQFQVLSRHYIEKTKREIHDADYRAAMICRTIAEPYRDEKRHGKPFAVEEFMPKRGEKKKKPKSDTEQVAIIEGIFGKLR